MELTHVSEKGFMIPLGKKIILGLFSKIKEGSLRVTFPDGDVRTYGSSPEIVSADIHIVNPKFYNDVLLYGDIGFGEAYTEGLWDTSSVFNVINLFIQNMDYIGSISGSKVKQVPLNFLKFTNRVIHKLQPNSVEKAKRNIQAHYDLSNDFFKLFLDQTMTYSSGYFESASTALTDAQIKKWDNLCDNLEINPTDHILEIGTGWGGFALHVTKKFGCRITTVTISEQQHKYAQELFQKEGVAHLIDLKLMDYRLIEGQFDKIVSIEMMEAIGHEYLPVFLKKVDTLLKPQGIFSFQTITSPDSRYDQFRESVDWIQKHIFPGSLLFSVGELNRVMNKVSELQLVKFLDMGHHYNHTLKLWDKKFTENKAKIKQLGFDEEFCRKWHYYFEYCAAAFWARNISVVQMTYVRPNNGDLKSLFSY
jgi:cyclopropane-fatty-acyl-phospholipid synthase